MARITIKNLHKAFGGFVAVKESSLVVEDGEFFCLLGPSGCGKTSTLRMIAGLELPTTVTIRLGEDDVTYRRAAERDIAFVFQLRPLSTHERARQYRLSAQMRRAATRRDPQPGRRSGVNSAHRPFARQAGFATFQRRPAARRLVRAIIRKPKAFLMDEPLGALDADSATSCAASYEPCMIASMRPPSMSRTISLRRCPWPTRSRS
jgi:multiple sugar transport system ATP-binding protein